MHILRKPFDFADIVRAVNHCLEREPVGAAA
jgi:hypothetical protein